MLKEERKDHIYLQCHQEINFAGIFEEVARKLNQPKEVRESVALEAQGGIKGHIPFFTEGKAGTARTSTTEKILRGPRADPVALMELLDKAGKYLVLDDFDKIQAETEKQLLAQTAKVFSDQAQTAKLILIGVADSAAELVSLDRTVQYRLAEVQVPRMSEEEIRTVIAEGARKLSMDFTSVAEEIVKLSDGLPKYTHHLCLECVREAKEHACAGVSPEFLPSAIRAVIARAGQSLAMVYNMAIRARRESRALHRKIVYALAQAEGQKVSATELEVLLRDQFGVQVPRPHLYGAITQLTQPGRASLLIRDPHRIGVVKFRDPLMKPFVRMLLRAGNGERLFPEA
jgi:hypothetical protein